MKRLMRKAFMQDWNDPLYKKIAETLPKGKEMADYVVSLSIEARK